MLGMEMLLKAFGVTPEAVQETIGKVQSSARIAEAAMVEILATQKLIRDEQAKLLAKLESMENDRNVSDANNRGRENGNRSGLGSAN